MTKKTHYGIISDVHHCQNLLPLTIQVLKYHGAQKLIINGDLSNKQETISSTQRDYEKAIKSIAKSNLESFINSGSHESLFGSAPVLEYYSKKFPNLIDTTKQSKISNNGHEIIFLPGSDYLCGGEYFLGNNPCIPTGRYIQDNHGLIKIHNLDDYMYEMNLDFKPMHYTNIQDLKKLITNPQKTIVACHIPRKFDDLDQAIDVAEFGEVKEDIYINDRIIKKSSVVIKNVAKALIKKQYPVELKQENRGNKDLKEIYEKLGIQKSISAHFHESSHRAHDSRGFPIAQDIFSDELFWNSGALSLGKTGILTVEDQKVSYVNINLNYYL